MLKSWKTWVLLVLLVGPYAIYITLGFLWLVQKGWLVASLAGFAGLVAGAVFYFLAARWTRSEREILPPIDWNAPATFSPVDRQAWEIVEEETERAPGVGIDSLRSVDVYIESGRRLANRLAKHYHPLSDDPVEDVPVIEFLTALELAAGDLNRLVRHIPGGDIVTAGHWKTAVQAAGYFTKANSVYSYILPMFNPLTGLSRLASQHLMVKPAWKSMQQNLLLWFFEAYVNRLGIHMIELYSGRLVIGAEQYRRLAKKIGQETMDAPEAAGPIKIAVVGARGSEHAGLVAAIVSARVEEHSMLLARLKGTGLGEDLLKKLVNAHWFAVDGYNPKTDKESSRDRATRRAAVLAAVDADLVVLWIDDSHATLAADVAFASEWDRWFIEHPSLERPPFLVTMLAMDRARLEAARAVLPPVVTEILSVDPSPQPPVVRLQSILPAIAAQFPRVERSALLRHLHTLSKRSKVGRLARQVTQTGKWLLNNMRKPSQTTDFNPLHRPEENTRI